PIPALDGSRLVFLLVEGMRGRPIDPQKESFVHFVGFTVLILLMIVIAYRDLTRLNLFF
ncbi:regulator of sigma E protease, partial [Candidatus Hakubella thermalkaliphila]